MMSVQTGMATRLKAQAGFTLTEVTIIQTAATAPVTVSAINSVRAAVLPLMTLDTEVSLTKATGATVGAGVSSPPNVRLSTMRMRRGSGNANILGITATGAYTGAA